eukprot:CAMPEP_0116032524 /NCGR_PEP_ID=MMETSP0321-20121206/18223_1 /TAXON_ID=163516 /ORGANISM="Leptocylindrus danicus var. danicus, Strain B650" /LENGTH=147 /DNA_ID=CAMNT_0003507981 /DNA_START=33 /DNA_END=476 /DNA_ORIENTATION=+
MRHTADSLLRTNICGVQASFNSSLFYFTTRRGLSDNVSKASANSDIEATEEETKLDLSKFTIPQELEFPDVAGNGGVSFKVAEGELIRRGDAICEVELAEFSFGMDSDEETDTVMGTIHVQEGDSNIEPGTPICTILHPEPPKDGED